MKTKSKIPALRFKGFTDAWEERKLKDVLYISKARNKSHKYGKEDVLSVSREVGTVNQIEYQGRSFAGSDISNYKVVQGGELIYTKSPLKGAPYGIFQVATLEGILSPLYAVYNSTDKAYTPFVAMALKTDSIATHYLSPLVAKGAKNTINVTDEGALQGKIKFPNILEQKQIFIFFKQLDETIALHQRKCEQTKELKKTMLQKMFPKKGERIPEIRFPEFTDEWEVRLFGDLLNETRVKTTVEDEDTLLSCAIDGMYLNSELFSHFRGSSNIGYLKVKKNDLILSAQNLHLGNCNVNLRFEHGMVSPAYKVYELVDCAPLFMQAWVKRDSTKIFFLRTSTEGASVCRKNILWDELYKQPLAVPILAEQQRIGAYFQTLDQDIAQIEKKLAALKELKKTLLRQLFV